MHNLGYNLNLTRYDHPQMDKINVLGTDYAFKEDDSLVSDGADGRCELYGKSITLRPKEMILDDGSKEAKEAYYRQVMRHEIIHAAFMESGLLSYTNDEVLVSWIAIQFPKLAEIFKRHGCE